MHGIVQPKGGIRRRRVPSGSLRLELEKTKRSARIGEQTGLFYVPLVIGFNEEENTIDFEYLRGLRTVQEVAVSDKSRRYDVFTRIGAALAAIHDCLVLSPELKRNLPHAWMLSDEDNVFVHGDFTAQNVCVHEPTNRIVILDWSTAPFIGAQSTFGSRYFDITWFIYFMFHFMPATSIVRWDAKSMSDAFMEGYIGHGRTCLKLCAFRRFHLEIEKLKRRKFWSGSRNYSLGRRIGYLALWFWKSHRYRRYEPRQLVGQSQLS